MNYTKRLYDLRIDNDYRQEDVANFLNITKQASGMYENGKEICRTWFSGFFPAKNPHYIVVVLNEKGEGGNADCAPVYRKICERIVFD